ncbi:MAG: shikimate kinase [Acidimicrobiales bacterium]
MTEPPSASLHWVLVGLMGVGKTTVGRPLAEAHGRPFIDSDEQLKLMTGMTARAIAEGRGTDTLHELEIAAVIDALDEPHPSVISAAAAVVDDDATVARLAGRAVVIWLDTTASVAATRAASGAHRPGALDEETLRAQRERRAPRYEALADIVVDASDDPADIVTRLRARLDGWRPSTGG